LPANFFQTIYVKVLFQKISRKYLYINKFIEKKQNILSFYPIRNVSPFKEFGALINLVSSAHALRSLAFGGGIVQSSQFERFAELIHLSTLDLSHCINLTDESLRGGTFLSANPLFKLFLPHTQIFSTHSYISYIPFDSPVTPLSNALLISLS
jgi:hypothetical protein